MSESPGQEIERKYLLEGMPPLPRDAVASRIEQGYLPEPDAGEDAPPPPPSGDDEDIPRVGRLRRRIAPDGTEQFTHTIKRGAGLVREEHERIIDRRTFDAAWPHTAGRRLAKTRHVVAAGDGFIWEIDEFADRPLVLAEVELPDAGARPAMPDWLAPHVVREVTDEPAFTNSALAIGG